MFEAFDPSRFSAIEQFITNSKTLPSWLDGLPAFSR